MSTIGSKIGKCGLAGAIAAAGVLAAVLWPTVTAAQSQFPTPGGRSAVPGVAILVPNGATGPGGQTVMGPPSSSNPLTATIQPNSKTSSVTAATVGTSSKQILPPAPTGRILLAIDNESTSATIACALGSTAALNSAGSFTIPAESTRVWDGNFVPSDAVDCIADGASTPVTLEAY